LVGNGVTSQLISDYKNENMIRVFKEQNLELYQEINLSFDIFRTKKYKAEQLEDDFYDIKNEILSKSNALLDSDRFDKFFITYGLIREIFNQNIGDIETLLKVANLFRLEKLIPGVEHCANKIYLNNGKNGIASISNSIIDVNKLTDYVSEFDYIFTTNFDSIIDDVYDKEVFHLHGGFNYSKRRESNGEIHIVKDIASNRPYLIWGVDQVEKEGKSQGGFSFPMSFPINFGGRSILQEYQRKLKSLDISELYIWGYSGLNDKHINNAISQNKNILAINIYCNPKGEYGSKKYEDKAKSSYNCLNNGRIKFIPWNEVWDRLH